MQSKLNISIDDVSPHPLSSTKVIDNCRKVIQLFPSVKFTLFIPLAYWRTQGTTSTSNPLLIEKHPSFCQYLKSLSQDNFEIAYHGYYHGIPGKSNNDEFQYLTKQQAIDKFNMMFEAAENAGLSNIFKPIFRPPAWRMSSAAILAAKEVGIEILALSPDKYAKETYCGQDEVFANVNYYNVNPPFKPLESLEKTNIVYHACEWDKNYLNLRKTAELIKFIQNEEFEFCFMEEMA